MLACSELISGLRCEVFAPSALRVGGRGAGSTASRCLPCAGQLDEGRVLCGVAGARCRPGSCIMTLCTRCRVMASEGRAVGALRARDRMRACRREVPGVHLKVPAPGMSDLRSDRRTEPATARASATSKINKQEMDETPSKHHGLLLPKAAVSFATQSPLFPSVCTRYEV